ncbi:hypothetical protein PM082_021274 [Marasmius tenuissimus]|nr:hypothetical protein PM082_021274 [Marasmius tenuissimus]
MLVNRIIRCELPVALLLADNWLSHSPLATIQTGGLTSVCAIIDLVLFLVDPTALYLTFNYALAKLYTNALLSSLNSRRGWGYTDGPSEDMARRTAGGNSRKLKKTPPSANRFIRVELKRPQEMVVNVNIESYELRDADVTASRAGTDYLEIGGTNELKAADTEYGVNNWA